MYDETGRDETAIAEIDRENWAAVEQSNRWAEDDRDWSDIPYADKEAV